MNPYLLMGALAFWVASVGFTGWVSYGAGADSEIADQAKLNKAIQDTRDAALQGAADAIAKNKPVNQTIVQKGQTVVRENTVYAECRNPPDGMRVINSALTGDTAEPAGGGILPKADPVK